MDLRTPQLFFLKYLFMRFQFSVSYLLHIL